jgi:hypothetical protein
MLAASGAKVTFVLDDICFEPNRLRHRTVVAALGHAMENLREQHEVIRLSRLKADAGPTPESLIAQLATANAAWEMRGEVIQEGRAQIEERNRHRLRAAFGPIAAAVSQVGADAIFLPGGVFGSSGLWVQQAKRAGMRVASFDNGGMGTWILATDGLACHHGDIPRAVAIFDRELTSAAREKAVLIAVEEIEARRRGTDIFAYQIKDSAVSVEALRGSILLALNSSWDSAALGIHGVFANNIEWIVESVRYLLDKTDVSVIVRQHPAERFEFARTSDDYASVLREQFGDHPRLHFIAASDPINSYALMEVCRAVLVHSSTIGNEAASMGLPVITASNPYFSKIGFVQKATTRMEYYSLLDDAAAGKLKVGAAERELAQLCYYATQVSNWVHSAFNPEQFKAWRKQPLSHWLDEPPTNRMVQALIDNVPVAVLNHAHRMTVELG